MRVAPAAKKALRERNQNVVRRGDLGRIEQDRLIKGVLNPDGGGTGKDKFASQTAVSAERIVGRILRQNLAENRLRPKIPSRYSSFYSGIASTRALQVVIAPVANVQKIRDANPSRR